jgi:hypothetical protein
MTPQSCGVAVSPSSSRASRRGGATAAPGAIGDRTPALRRDPHGGLTIAIGHDRPPAGGNRLPAPAGPCVLVLRAYEGRAGVVAASGSRRT